MEENKTSLVPGNISPESLENFKRDFCTVGKLLKFLNEKLESGDLTEDSLVLSQRIEDRYFETDGWGVVRKKGWWYHYALDHNKKIDECYYLNKEEFPNIEENDPILNKYSEEDLEQIKDQYHPVFCPVFYNDDNNLFLDSHY